MRKLFLFLTTLVFVTLMVGNVMAVNTVVTPTEAQVAIPGYVAITVTNIPITFGYLNPGDNNNATTSPDLNVHVEDATNVNVKVQTRDSHDGSGDFYFDCSGSGCNANGLPIGNLKWSAMKTGGTFTTPIGYTNSDATACSTLLVNQDCTMKHTLSIPNALTAGDYHNHITVTASQG